jgi:mannosyltransferase
LRIALDAIIYQLQEGGGVSVYFSELLQELAKVAQVEVDVWTFRRSITAVQPVVSPAYREFALQSRVLERYRACRLQGTRPDVFHSSYYRSPDDPLVPSVVTVHDFAYERLRRGPALWMHRSQKWRAIRGAQVVVCVSQATADDLLEYVGLRSDQTLKVIHNGVSDVFRPDSSAAVVIGEVLFVGTRWGYKNFGQALQAMALLPEVRLVCVGGGPLRDEEFAGVPPGVRERVVHRGFVSNDELAALYRQSRCLLYPSSFEGFGIPVAEAMRSGCPVVGLMTCKAVVEVAGDALCGVDELQAPALAQAIDALRDAKWRASIVQRGIERSARYTWAAAHAQTLEAYREAVMRGRRA